MINNRTTIIALALIICGLTACQQQPEEPQVEEVPAPPQISAPAVAPPPPVILELNEESLKQIGDQADDQLTQAAPQRLDKAKQQTKKVEVGGGVLTDMEAESLKETVTGGEVKVEIKLD